MRTLLLSLILIANAPNLFSRDIFLFHDKSCMDKYVFRPSDHREGPDDIAYVIHLPGGGLVHLETGEEDQTPSYSLPGKLTSCSSMQWDPSLVDDITGGKHELFVVSKNNRQYYSSRVKSMALLTYDQGKLTFYGKGMHFISSLNEPVGQINLSQKNAYTDVYFKGHLSYHDCPAYQYLSVPRLPGRDLTEITVVPGTGIVEIRAGQDAAAADMNGWVLSTINQIPVITYIQTRGCSPHATAVAPSGTPTDTPSGSTTAKSGPANTPAAAPPPPVVNPCRESAIPGTHLVQSGESLFAISRQYSVSVPEIKRWNKLSSDVIKPCQRLWVTSPTAGGTTVAASKPVAGAAAKTVSTKVPQLWKTNKGFHTVQKGETLSLLSKMYGYSLERLMEMNDLKTTDIKEGQILKINDCVCDADKNNASMAVPAGNQGSDPNPSPAGNEPAMSADNREGGGGAAESDKGNVPDEWTEKSAIVHYHTVSEGETLYTIARLYQTTVEWLREKNGLDLHEVLIAGQRLIVK